MIWEFISSSSRGSKAFTLPCVPTGMKTGVSITPRGVVKRPRRALDPGSVFSNSNIQIRFPAVKGARLHRLCSIDLGQSPHVGSFISGHTHSEKYRGFLNL